MTEITTVRGPKKLFLKNTIQTKKVRYYETYLDMIKKYSLPHSLLPYNKTLKRRKLMKDMRGHYINQSYQ